MEKETLELPHNQEAEQAMLASLILDNKLINEAREALSAEHFFNNQNKVIYNAIIELNKDKKPVDIIILGDHLKNTEISDVQLTKIVIEQPTSANFPYYADIVKGHYIRRLVIKESRQFIEQASSSEDYSDLLSTASQKLSKLARQEIKASIVMPSDLAKTGEEDFTNRLTNEIDFTGLSSGFVNLDKLCGGFGEGDIIVVAGQTGVGKTTFLLDIVRRQCIDTGLGCAYFSLEMSQNEIFYRLISKMSCVALSNIKSPKCLTGKEKETFYQSVANLKKSRFFLADTPLINLNKILVMTRKMKAKEDIDFICVDYLQLIPSESKTQARYEALSEITKELKQLARELSIPVIAGAQLNRAIQPGKEPGLSNMGESFAIGQHADTVILVSRDDIRAVFNVAKARQGRGGKFNLVFDSDTISFNDKPKGDSQP